MTGTTESSATRMQIEADQSLCPVCTGQLASFSVLHHLICAYVGPEYDFTATAAGLTCPKCRRAIVANDPACEIVGISARCSRCRSELVVSPSAHTVTAQATDGAMSTTRPLGMGKRAF
jgi:hypothetical protein